MITAMLLINAELREVADVTKALAEVPEITELYTTAGEYDVVAKIMVKDLDLLADVVTGRIAEVEGIIDTSTLLAIRCHSESAMGHMFGVGIEEE
jgi:DNA-binding Lrp family transcriptional regulator